MRSLLGGFWFSGNWVFLWKRERRGGVIKVRQINHFVFVSHYAHALSTLFIWFRRKRWLGKVIFGFDLLGGVFFGETEFGPVVYDEQSSEIENGGSGKEVFRTHLCGPCMGFF